MKQKAALLNKNTFMLWLIACLALVLLDGCAARERRIADLAELPQSASWYQARVEGADWRAKPGFQKGMAAEWRANWFEPWLKPDPQAGAAQIKEDGEDFIANPGFGENLLARRNPYFIALIKNSSWQNYPNAGWNAITTNSTDLRLLPSAKPVYSSPEPGEGFPFDRMQQTSLPPNTPVYVHHQTKDRAWLLVQTPLAWGWLPAGQTARIAQSQAERIMGCDLMAITAEEADVAGLKHGHLFKASIGAVLPLIGESQRHWQTLVAVKDYQGRAVLISALIEKTSAARFPAELNAKNIARLADRVMGQAYGWGGLYGDRDCSGFMRDLFAACGLWLPRNSTDQAQKGGRFMDLAGLDARAKKQAIMRDGIPFLSLVWLPGHIMLYVGAWQGEPLVLHNMWALRTGNNGGIIGRAVITTLEPGRERADLERPDGLLINRVGGITLLAPASALKD
jgi:hypothetical protein